MLVAQWFRDGRQAPRDGGQAPGDTGSTATARAAAKGYAFEVTAVLAGGTVVITARGEIDLGALDGLDRILGTLPDTAAVVLDLAGVTFMDLAGLRFLVRLHARAERHGDDLVILGLRGQAGDLFTLATELRLVPAIRHARASDPRGARRVRADAGRTAGREWVGARPDGVPSPPAGGGVPAQR
ncbi:STAS domain-containing protein [Streptomyces sp. NPDC059382]|uniref:STAS domain-containing protein n=1 Tax=Streptomyces sp. NPDC059382 TaxID=3346816 RepID=UPI0036A2D763